MDKPCNSCGSMRMVSVLGKCDDRSAVQFLNIDVAIEGEIDYNFGIGEGDHIEFIYCLDCSHIDGKFPRPVIEGEAAGTCRRLRIRAKLR